MPSLQLLGACLARYFGGSAFITAQLPWELTFGQDTPFFCILMAAAHLLTLQCTYLSIHPKFPWIDLSMPDKPQVQKEASPGVRARPVIAVGHRISLITD